MDALKTLAQRLRDKASRDNRALLDEAANAIETLSRDTPCPWCSGEKKLISDGNRKAEILTFPSPHIRVDLGGQSIGITLNFCPLCGRCLDGVSRLWK